MNLKDKELLLKDLCTRLPYGVKVNEDIQGDFTLVGLTKERAFTTSEEEGYYNDFPIELVKPYLFPISSMTEEQRKEMSSFDPFKTDEVKTLGKWAVCLVNFYNKYHLDYNGLIPKGLALDATGLNIY